MTTPYMNLYGKENNRQTKGVSLRDMIKEQLGENTREERIRDILNRVYTILERVPHLRIRNINLKGDAK